MNQILIFILGAVFGGAIVWFLKNYKDSSSRCRIGTRNDNNKELETAGLIEKQAEEKKRNKEAILGVLETQTPLTNNHIEQLLGISDATATRYLEELEKEGKIRQVGKTGQSVYYEKV